MIRKVNVCSVGQIQSGTSQQTGNQWRKQEFVVEWYESPSDTQSQKIVLSVMNDNIEKLKVQVGDKMEVRFDLRYREYNGRYYMDVYAPFDAMKKTGGLQHTGQPAGESAGTAGNQQQQAPAGQKEQMKGYVGQQMEQREVQMTRFDADGNPVNGNDLPF
jgi:hypothetical protein